MFIVYGPNQQRVWMDRGVYYPPEELMDKASRRFRYGLALQHSDGLHQKIRSSAELWFACCLAAAYHLHLHTEDELPACHRSHARASIEHDATPLEIPLVPVPRSSQALPPRRVQTPPQHTSRYGDTVYTSSTGSGDSSDNSSSASGSPSEQRGRDERRRGVRQQHALQPGVASQARGVQKSSVRKQGGLATKQEMQLWERRLVDMH